MVRLGEDDPGLDLPLGRVLLDAVEGKHIQAGGTDRRLGPLRMPCVFEAGIGDEQHPPAAELADDFAQQRDRPRFEQHSPERLEVEWRQSGRIAPPAGGLRW